MFGLTITYVKTAFGTIPDPGTVSDSFLIDTWQEVTEVIKDNISASLGLGDVYDHIAYVITEPQTDKYTYCVARWDGLNIPKITHANFDLDLLNC